MNLRDHPKTPSTRINDFTSVGADMCDVTWVDRYLAISNQMPQEDDLVLEEFTLRETNP